MAISKRLRYELLRRDNHQCRYCGRPAPEVKLTVDHVVPETLGGSDKPDNLVAACADCNSGKSATPPDAPLVADVAQDQVRWALAMDAVIEQRATQLAAERKRIGKFDRKWRSYTVLGEPFPRDLNWKNSINRFMAFGLDDQFLADAVETAVGSPKPRVGEVWKYFCGICWREIEDMQELAQQQLAPVPAPLPTPLAPAELAPDGAPAHTIFFPYMEMIEALGDTIVTRLGCDLESQNLVNNAIWAAMPDAHRVYTDQEAAGADHEGASELALQEFESGIEPYMRDLQQRNTARMGLV